MISASFDAWAAAQEEQPAKDANEGEVQKSDRHSPRSCLITVSGPNRRSQPPCGVLERYTPHVPLLVCAAQFFLVDGRYHDARDALGSAVEVDPDYPLAAKFLEELERNPPAE